MFYQLLKYVLLGPLLRLMFRPRVEGLEHVPEEGRRSSRATTSPSPTTS